MPLRAVQFLREEHRWIGCMLDALAELLESARSSGRLDGESAAELLALFVHFADGVHQRREEACLFPRLLARARSVDERLAIGRLCGEHERERLSLRVLEGRLLGAVYGASHELHDFIREAELFLAMHRRHVAEENLQLLPLSEVLLDERDDELLLVAFRDVEQGGPGRDLVGQRVRAVCERLGVEATESPGGA